MTTTTLRDVEKTRTLEIDVRQDVVFLTAGEFCIEVDRAEFAALIADRLDLLPRACAL